MNNNTISSKHLRLPTSIVTAIEKEGNEFGYKFSEWVKIILTQRAIEIKEKSENIDAQLVKDIIQGRIEANEKQLPQLKSKKDIEDFMKSI